MLIVMKFGGSLLAGRRGSAHAAEIVQRHSEGNDVLVVVSALGTVTDILLEAAESARAGDNKGTEGYLRKIRKVHLDALDQLSKEKQTRMRKGVEVLLEALKQALKGVSLLKELTPRSKDLILSFGERLSVQIVAAAIQDRGIDSTALTGAEAGIVTDDNFGEAYPDFGATRRGAKRAISLLLSRRSIPVVAGFVGATKTGEVTTLGRGGSDYTATILAAALGADEVWIWTDVDGILTADPRIVANAQVIEELSYAEAEEMAIFGAKNMHPLALGPARLAKIPVRIRNGHRPDLPGTLIHGLQERKAGVAKAVMLVRRVGMLTVSGETLMGRPGTAGQLLSSLGDMGVNIFMISQSVSESNISMVVRRDALQRAREAIESGQEHFEQGLKVDAEHDVAVVAAVGAGMKGTPGVAARVFGTVSQVGVNVRMIAQGSSELNISFVVREKEALKAVRALHSTLVGGR